MNTVKQGQIALSVLLILAVCFVAYAIYSPLHVHKNGQCSLNSVDQQTTDSVVQALVLPVPSAVASALVAERHAAPVAPPHRPASGRDPPPVASQS